MVWSTRFGLSILFGFLALPASGQTTSPLDLPHRDAAIVWPKPFDPSTAPVFSHNELLMQASCHRVWTRLTDVGDWPNWFILTKEVELEQPGTPIGKGSVIRLKIFGSPITSRIDQFVPDSRFSWFPQGLDEKQPAHYHTWYLAPQSSGCRVVTEEVGIGPNDLKQPAAVSSLMHRAHDLWLASLKYTSEQPSR